MDGLLKDHPTLWTYIVLSVFSYHPETSILGKGLPQEKGGDAQQKIGITTCKP